MVRLIDGCGRAINPKIIDERMFRFGIIAALIITIAVISVTAMMPGTSERCRIHSYPHVTRRMFPWEMTAAGRMADLVFKAPRFRRGAAKRFREDLGGHHIHIDNHFDGQNLYFDELEKKHQLRALLRFRVQCFAPAPVRARQRAGRHLAVID